MNTPTIDLITFRALQQDTGTDFVAELVDTFIQETPTILANMRAAHAAQDTQLLHRAAHSIKSNGQAFGASALVNLARAIEIGDSPVDATTVDALAAEYERTTLALKELCNE